MGRYRDDDERRDAEWEARLEAAAEAAQYRLAEFERVHGDGMAFVPLELPLEEDA
jgi:hypothetical protein